MPDTTTTTTTSPLPSSTSFEEKPVEKKGLMLPPPIPNKEARGDGPAAAGVPGPPPRMTRLPSLKQLSDHLHYTPSSTSTSQFPSPSQSTSIPATPPSLRIATGSSLPQGTPGGAVSQSPLIAPSPSSRLRLPASAMMRSLSSGSNGMGTPLETVHSPNWVSRGMPGGTDIFGNSSPTDALKESPIANITPQTANTNGVAKVLPGREIASPMSRTNSSNSYIQGYSNVPSLDQIRRRISVSQGSKPPSTVDPAAIAPILANTNDMVASPAPATATATATKEKDMESPPQSASLTASSSSSVESGVANGRKKKEHPLRHAWTLFFDSKTYKPDPTAIAPKDGGKALTDYELTLLTVGKFDTVEGFARHLNNVRLPSLLNKNSNYHMFKNGIRPMWEDPSNANGGKWVILFRNSPPTLDVAWANLTMALVGEVLDEEDEVCGIVASNRPKIDRIQVWTRSRDDHEKLNRLGRKVLEVMNLDGKDRECMSMEYQYNATNSHPPSGLFLHIPFPTTRTPLSTPTPNRSSAPTPVGLGISSSTSPRLGTLTPVGRSPTNATFPSSSSTGGGMLEPPTGGLTHSLSQRRLSGGNGANAFAGPMGMGRIGSSSGLGLGGGISRGSSPALSTGSSPTPTPRALKG
ncbi:hypothetical protein I302_101538 [Kwoniella bestiolae CBS 10118]|uniref:Translation initiation factor 4E n=1 Tax=Kwoniella bestiolae CBS 10118 TaxID=1296100 RepID=A0A1B9GCJ0_9TREE|nr:hypothetical protein I302_00223 [Kwoniella bestiolae CBS 10118]OCF28734.1 hypothetical protein I302_00223 [Kwoniella bestiolae CBS 10118]